MPVNGLDLETNCYLVQGTKFEVDKRYKIIEPMSHGAYGIVCSAMDQDTRRHVAVKKIEGVFEHVTITKRTLRELRILRHLQHENLMRVKNIFITGTLSDYEEIYVVSELMETDLASTLRSSQPFTDDHCQFFLYQILRGMKYVHSAQVIHRDLKPRNLLVNSNCDLKICDFGLARMQFSDKEWVCPMTEYVCTRWYRAPEVLCSWTDYSGAIDIWSIGCILAEMHMRQPLYPGRNTQHQLDLIIGLLGSPEGEELMKIPNEKCRKFIKSLPPMPGRPFQNTSQTCQWKRKSYLQRCSGGTLRAESLYARQSSTPIWKSCTVLRTNLYASLSTPHTLSSRGERLRLRHFARKSSGKLSTTILTYLSSSIRK